MGRVRGRVRYVHIPERVCDGRVKNRDWGWDSGQKETQSVQKESASEQGV